MGVYKYMGKFASADLLGMRCCKCNSKDNKNEK